MDSYIDLKNIVAEDLKHVDLDRVNVNCSPPEVDPQRQYYFIAKCRQLVKAESERLGRPLYACSQVFGCQMNARDSEKLSGILVQAGYVLTDSEEDADFVLYNTCTVRDNANQRVYGRLGYLNSLKKKKPHLKIALCGCMMQEQTVIEKIRKSYRFVDLIFGTHNLFEFSRLLAETFSSHEMIVDVWDGTDKIVENLPVKRKYTYKSGVNIMFGCNNFCSYCIVPYVRGRERSREPKDILREIESLVEDGVSEVMLLGQNVNSYGKNLENPMTFAGLLREVEKIEGLRRIRFMTSHPKDLSDELIEVMQRSTKICSHLHLPLQAGSDRILQAMNRRYTREQYLTLVDKIKKAIPDIAITTDLIVGFPGETPEDVDETIDMVQRVQFDNAFTFIYSPRTGTPAAAMENQVPEEVVHEGFDRLLAVVQETAKARAALLEGRIMEALVEGVNEQDPALVTGRLDNNMLVHFKADRRLIGKYVMVTLDTCHGFYYTGRMVDCLGHNKHTRLGKMVDNQWLN